MRHIRKLEEAGLIGPSVVTIGAFDGVHRGHQSLIGQLLAHAAESRRVPVVLTFHPHPEMVLRGQRPGFYLTMPERRAALLGALGVELVVTHPFDESVRQIRAAEFVDRLIANLQMSALWVGSDFAMGYRREGDVPFLQRQADARGFGLRVVDLMDAGGERVSSTRIRDALAAGEVQEASRLLGRLYSVPGRVVRGVGRGSTIGIPTANLDIAPEQAIPLRGVYAGWVEIKTGMAPAVVNIGLRPTFDGSGSLTVEAHLLDFTGDLYAQEVELHFAARLRDEQRFDGIAALVAQIQADIGRARQLLMRSPEHGPLPPG